MPEKSIIIIGAGIAGLSAGCYGQMNGYDTQIFEMHDQPGGLCTAWKRKGYTIDGCLHWLVGSAPDSNLYHLWREVGVLPGKRVINMEQFYRVEGTNGKVFTLYTDVDRLDQHMKEISPKDASLIGELTKTVRHLTRFGMSSDKAGELYSAVDGLRMLFKMVPFLGDFRKWGKLTMNDLAQRFNNPLLRQAFRLMWPAQFSTLALLLTLAWMAKRDAGYVIGGSREISRSIEKRYLNLGGQIHYKSSVSQILVENNRAVGVKLADGSEHRADYVISAADGHATIFDMLEGRYLDDKIRGYYETMPIFQPLVYIGLGVNRSFEDVPQIISGIILPLDTPINIVGQEHQSLSFRVHNFDTTLAPPGKTVLTVMFQSTYRDWELLRQDLPRYRAEKERIAKAVVGALDKRFPGLAGQVEMWMWLRPLPSIGTLVTGKVASKDGC